MAETTAIALGIAVAARAPVLLWGAPGTGKSSAVQAMASAMDWPCEVVIASIREPSDFAGLPVVIDGNVRFAPPTWATKLATSGHGVLFLDEISTAPPAVQAALLRVVLERVVGDLELPDNVAVVAAANPPEQAADGWDLSAPLANRFCHLDWQVDAGRSCRGTGCRLPDADRARTARLLGEAGWAHEGPGCRLPFNPARPGVGASNRQGTGWSRLAEPEIMGDGRSATGCLISRRCRTCGGRCTGHRLYRPRSRYRAAHVAGGAGPP